MMKKAAFFVCLFAWTGLLSAQDSLFQKWQDRATRIQSKQPAWSPPIVAPYPMVVQVFRSDFIRQITPARTSTWVYGAGRGLNLIPGFNSEVDVYYPSYFQRNSRTARDGFGDVGFLYKYRILSANEKNGSYMLSAQVTATVPTGDHANGSTDASVTPTLVGGKGFGRFDIISSVGGALPTGSTNRLGRTIAWNTTAQVRLGHYVWPEVETNMTRFFGGRNDGKTQNFITPGLTFSRFKYHPKDTRSRAGIAFGAGIQIATSQFHSYNHAVVFSSRFVF